MELNFIPIGNSDGIIMSFFAELPPVPEAYGGDTDAYLEAMEEPEDEWISSMIHF